MKSDLVTLLYRAAERHGVTLWLVGGPIRDQLLDRPYDDWDMVCRKAKLMALDAAKQLRAKFITLDDQNKIYRVILPEAHQPIRTLDFAELQGGSIEADLPRRDFTINAMALRLTPAFSLGGKTAAGWVSRIIDPLGGQRDLKKGVLRAVSKRVFLEDALRLVRAFRFMAQFQLTIEPRTLVQIKKDRDRLSTVAAERIREELLRLWKQPRACHALRLMDRVRLLTILFPGMESCRRTAIRYYGKGGVLEHSLETVENFEWILNQLGDEDKLLRGRGGRKATVLQAQYPAIRQYLQEMIGGYPRQAWLKWASFLHDIGKPATAKIVKGRLRFFAHEHVGAVEAMRCGKKLRCSRQETQLLGLWVRNHMRLGNLAAAPQITGKALSRFFRDLGADGVGMVLISLADHYTYLSKSLWGRDKDSVEKMGYRLLTSYLEKREQILPKRLVNGHDLMRKLKLKPGPFIGRLLENIQDAQVEGKVKTPEDALDLAKRLFKKSNIKA